MIKYLGHEFVKDDFKDMTYHCLRCKCLAQNFNYIDSFDCVLDGFTIKLGLGHWKHNITCDEMIIKGIIE